MLRDRSLIYPPMAGLSQSQTLSQQQVLAPQLQQSLQILQAPMLELRNLIQQELCTNPTLEEDQMEPTIEDKKAGARGVPGGIRPAGQAR